MQTTSWIAATRRAVALSCLLATSAAPAAGTTAPGEAPRLRAACRAQRVSLRPGGVGQTRATSCASVDPSAIRARGEALVLSKDDTLLPRAWASGPRHEGWIALPPGATLPRFAFRFETEFFVHEFPVEVTGVDLVFDNAFGRQRWPEVAFYGEDPSSPRHPDLTRLLATGGALDTTVFPAPAVAGVPDRWQSFTVDLAAAGQAFAVPLALTVDDASMSDAFDRPADEALDNPSSPWAECGPAGCDAPSDPKNLQVIAASGTVRKTLSEPVYGFRTQPTGAAWQERPVPVHDYAVSVRYDVTAPSARQAGVAARVQYLDGFYYAAYEKPGSVALRRKDGGGFETTLGSATVAAADSGRIELRVVGTSPAVELTVLLNGIPVIGPVQDVTGPLSSPSVGIYSETASSGEVWDDLVVRRNPDVYVVLRAPAGPPVPDARLPADLSSSSIAWRNVLVTGDSVSWSRPAAPSGCKPPNGFAALRVRDATDDGKDNVFDVETGVRELRLGCATCGNVPAACAAIADAGQRLAPKLATGKPVDVFARFWIDHAKDLPPLGNCTGMPPASLTTSIEFQVFEEPGIPAASPLAVAGACPGSGTRIHAAAEPIGVLAGQTTIGGPDQVSLCVPDPGDPTKCIGEAAWTTFTPATPGVHCIEACEAYDLDNDCLVPDEPSPDHRPLTRCVSLYVEVVCAVAGTYDPASLRLVKKDLVACAAGEARAMWTLRGPPGADKFNLHEIVGRGLLAADRSAAPYPEPFATAPIRSDIAAGSVCFAPAAGTPAFYGVWEEDCNGLSGADP